MTMAKMPARTITSRMICFNLSCRLSAGLSSISSSSFQIHKRRNISSLPCPGSSANKRSFSKSSSTLSSTSSKIYCLDVRGFGLSMLERLSLEEALLRHTNDNWIIIGTHEIYPHKYLWKKKDNSADFLPTYVSSFDEINEHCMIVMGIGGKPKQLINIDNVIDDNVLVVKRFSGGGTVVMDYQSVWTTLIGRTSTFPTVDPYPRSIMEWSAEKVFGPTFDNLTKQTIANKKGEESGDKTLVLDSKSCSASENIGKLKVLRKPNDDEMIEIPPFSLRENDYVLGKDKKMGGNAQSIIKGGWLHHTSFLWDYDSENMERYLQMPTKRPAYREERSHTDFLIPLSRYFGRSYAPFVSHLKQSCQESFPELKVAHLPTVWNEVIEKELGGIDTWFDTNRTKILKDLE